MKESTVHIYVSSIGNDGADGTEDYPFASLQRAQMKARSATRQGKAVHVWVREGTYYLSETMRFLQKWAQWMRLLSMKLYPGRRLPSVEA